jgi:hypothetical protein
VARLWLAVFRHVPEYLRALGAIGFVVAYFYAVAALMRHGPVMEDWQVALARWTIGAFVVGAVCDPQVWRSVEAIGSVSLDRRSRVRLLNVVVGFLIVGGGVTETLLPAMGRHPSQLSNVVYPVVFVASMLAFIGLFFQLPRVRRAMFLPGFVVATPGVMIVVAQLYQSGGGY